VKRKMELRPIESENEVTAKTNGSEVDPESGPRPPDPSVNDDNDIDDDDDVDRTCGVETSQLYGLIGVIASALNIFVLAVVWTVYSNDAD